MDDVISSGNKLLLDDVGVILFLRPRVCSRFVVPPREPAPEDKDLAAILDFALAVACEEVPETEYTNTVFLKLRSAGN